MTASLRPQPRAAASASPLWDRLTLALVVVAAALVVITFTDYGVTWDEDVHTWYGVFVLQYYLSGFHDLRSLHWGDLYYYGAAFDMAAAALNKVSPFGIYETRHLLNGLVGILGIIGVSRLGRTVAGPRAGFIAALFLLLTPNYYGQMFNNPKDIPFAVGMVWAFYYTCLILAELPRPRGSVVAKLGLAVGLTLGVRVGGLLLFCYLGLMMLLHVGWRGLETRRLSTIIAESWNALRRVLLPVLLIAYPIMLFFWPWAQQSPFIDPVKALLYFSHEIFPFRTLFDGRYIEAADLPWSYLPTYIALALPELILALLMAAPVVALVTAQRRGWRFERTATLQLFLLAFGIVFPVLYAIAIRAVLFDGMRHFIFVLPLIAALTAVLADRGLAWLQRATPRRRALRPLAYGALGLYGLVQIGIMAMLHPDEYVYYNALVGGVEGAAGRFKLDYWANSYAEAVQGLEDHLRAQYGADFMKRDFTVAVCGPPNSAVWYFPDNFIFRANRDAAEFFIAFTKDNCDKALPGKVIYRVERMGTVLSEVIDRRAILAQERKAGAAFADRGK